MIDYDKIEELIGKPYDAQDFHCWTLVEELVPNAPKVEVIGGSYRLAKGGFERNAETIADKVEVQGDPQEGDIILVGSKKSLIHAGVLLIDSGNRLVIHNDKDGVHIVPMIPFMQQYAVVKVFRC